VLARERGQVRAADFLLALPMNRRLIGSAPTTSRTAAWATACAAVFPFVSATPRANSFPSSTTGSKGARRHSAMGSTGWTS